MRLNWKKKTSELLCSIYRRLFDTFSVTRFDDFESSWRQKVLTKLAQMIGNFLGNFEKSHSFVKTTVTTFYATLGNIWTTFYSNIWSHWHTFSTSVFRPLLHFHFVRSLSNYMILPRRSEQPHSL